MDPAALQVLHYVLEARRRGEPERVDLPGVDLRGAQLVRADLVSAHLSGVGLDHAALAGAKLSGAQLDQALMRWADLNGADLTGANLQEADLSWARIEGASFAGANLRGAAIEGVEGEPASFGAAELDYAACERSGLTDDDVIVLWNAGAVLLDIEAFSPRVQAACSADAAGALSEAGPSARDLHDIDAQARMARAEEDGEVPPSARFQADLHRMSGKAEADDAATPMSMRSLSLVADVVTPEMVAAGRWKEGDRVLGVDLESLIGEGCCARVWRARDDDDGQWAVKLFDVRRASVGLSLSSFRRGVQVMNRLATEGDALPGSIVKLRAVTLNRLGFVMPLADNGSAVDLPALALDARGIAEFMISVCRAVQVAHELGVLHRCIKPSNILLDDDLDPILADFDIVDLPTLNTERPRAAGYAPYAAPEELIGAGTHSPTADIYSLGRVLYFLMLGEDPDEPVAEVPELEALTHHPAGLSRIVRKCTMRAPESRYQQVAELIDDLERYEDYESVGVAGGAAEANYTPRVVSSLPRQKRWLEGDGREDRGRSSAGEERARAKKRRRRRGEPEPVPETPAWEKGLGAFGAFMVLVSMLWVELSGGKDPALARNMQVMSGIGGAGMSFLLPRFANRPMLWRGLLALIGALLLYFANLPSLFG